MDAGSRRLPPADAFLHHVERSRLKSLFQAVWDSYALTHRQISEKWPGKVGIALRPQAQHANVQQALVAVAERYNDPGLVGRFAPNKNKSEWHAEITAGPVTLTDLYLPSLVGNPRRAQYRAELAESNLFSLFEAPAIEVDTTLYALLVHGFEEGKAEDRVSRKRPDFALVTFPLEDAQSLANISINLFTMFPEVVRGERRGAQESIADQAMPEIRDENFGAD